MNIFHWYAFSIFDWKPLIKYPTTNSNTISDLHNMHTIDELLKSKSNTQNRKIRLIRPDQNVNFMNKMNTFHSSYTMFDLVYFKNNILYKACTCNYSLSKNVWLWASSNTGSRIVWCMHNVYIRMMRIDCILSTLLFLHSPDSRQPAV